MKSGLTETNDSKISLSHGDTEPQCFVEHMAHIKEVLVLTTVARLRQDSMHNGISDGKNGLWRCVSKYQHKDPVGIASLDDWKPKLTTQTKKPKRNFDNIQN